VGGDELAGLVRAMREAARAAERDPAALELSLGHLVTKIDAGRAQRLADQGADRVVLAMPPTADLGVACEALSECARRLELS
jgi:hypothetical protein